MSESVGDYLFRIHNPEQYAAEQRQRAEDAERARAWWAHLNQIGRTNAVLRVVLEVHRSVDERFGDGMYCVECQLDVPWPCLTVKAVSRAVGLLVPPDVADLRREDLE